MSEMLLKYSRLKGMYVDEDGALKCWRGVDFSAHIKLLFSLTESVIISLLDAATNDLAQFVNHLDLEATLDMTSMRIRNP